MPQKKRSAGFKSNLLSGASASKLVLRRVLGWPAFFLPLTTFSLLQAGMLLTLEKFPWQIRLEIWVMKASDGSLSSLSLLLWCLSSGRIVKIPDMTQSKPNPLTKETNPLSCKISSTQLVLLQNTIASRESRGAAGTIGLELVTKRSSRCSLFFSLLLYFLTEHQVRKQLSNTLCGPAEEILNVASRV